MASQAFLEAISPETTAVRKTQLEQELLAYCARDTLGTVKLWELFSGRTTLVH